MPRAPELRRVRPSRSRSDASWSSFGFATKGIVYLVLGTLAVLAAVGLGGRGAGTGDVLLVVARHPLGSALLVPMVCGLAGYAVFRLHGAVTGRPYRGRPRATLERVGGAASGLVHLALTAGAAQVLAAGHDTQSPQTWLAAAVVSPAGLALLGFAGAGVAGLGVFQAYRAYTVDFAQHIRGLRIRRARRASLIRLGRLGLASRAAVFAMTGLALMQVSLTGRPVLGADVAGRALLALIAAGLAAYGLFMMACARYRELSGETLVRAARPE